MTATILALLGTIPPKVAPIFGVAAFAAMLQVSAEAPIDTGTAAWAWRLIVTFLLGIFVTLCGVIYQNVSRRQERQSADIEKVSSRQQRMIGILTVLVAKGESFDADKLLEKIQEID